MVRADPLAGDEQLGNALIAEIDAHRWPEGGLSSSQLLEIRKLKARVEAERLPRGADPAKHTKLGPGGIADVEFLVDYWVLAHSRDYPELVEFPDNIRQLEGLARVGLVPEELCLRLKEAYLALRQRVHELALDEGGRVVPEAELAPVRDFVSGVWRDVFADVEGE